MIQAGRVNVNGKLANKLGLIIDEANDEIEVDGQSVKLPEDKSYVILNKPKGYISSLLDKYNRPTVIDLIKGVSARVYPIGRLDLDTEGILLLTDDGELAFRLAHPKFEVKKAYIVSVKGYFPAEFITKFEEGITLEDGSVAHGKAKFISAHDEYSVVQLELSEGKKREIRRMFSMLGYNIKHLKRIRFADISCEGMRTGSWRYLNRKEITKLKKKVGLL
jgi:23S rRNA pseudouridine2605 synthase